MTEIAPPTPITEDDFLTLPEIAYLGRNADGEPLKRGTVESWRARNDRPSAKAFLDPDDYIGSTPVWRLERVLAWLDSKGLKHSVKAWKAKRKEGGFRRWADR